MSNELNYTTEIQKMNVIEGFSKRLGNYCTRYKVDLLVSGFHQFLTAEDFVKFNHSYFMSMQLYELESLLVKPFEYLGIKFYREV